jgi:hypothetical protein
MSGICYLDRADNLEARDEIKYNNGFGYLSELTFYRQSFYKTRYVYGFGRTEDVPVGLSLGLTVGYLRLLSVERPYGSIEFHYGQASRKGNFYGIDVQTGGFVRSSAMEDVVLESRATYFTCLWHLKKYRVRSVVSTTYTKIFNQQIIRWLNVNEAEIPGFQTESLEAEQRIAIHLESEVFTLWSLFGFRMAPFAALDIVPLRCRSCDESAQLFWGVSAGMRTRNENLIFGTLELKDLYT